MKKTVNYTDLNVHTLALPFHRLKLFVHVKLLLSCTKLNGTSF